MKKKSYSSICLLCLMVIVLCACGKQEQERAKEETIKLTLETVRELAQKGNELTWSDFEQYESVDIGSGLYILRYKIDENYELRIGGGNLEESPMYIRLVSAQNSDNYIDIRTGNIDDFIDQAETNTMWDRIPMVMVNDKLYYDTGKESTVSGRCGNMDGEITLEVDGSEIPTENNQSNFGTGFGYQYGVNDTIEIYMNEKWFVFEYREEKEHQSVEPIEPSIVKTYKVTDSDTAFEDDELVTMVKYYEMSDGTWKTDNYAYQYRLEITGRMGGAEKDSTFVFLSNIENITFEQAWKAAGFSSNMDDYFKEEGAKLVALK